MTQDKFIAGRRPCVKNGLIKQEKSVVKWQLLASILGNFTLRDTLVHLFLLQWMYVLPWNLNFTNFYTTKSSVSRAILFSPRNSKIYGKDLDKTKPPYSWFSPDVNKIQTKKLSLLLSFYFHVVFQHLLKTFIQTNFRFKRVLRYATLDA